MITAETMQALVDHHDGPCVSVYMPTHRYGRATQQDPIRLKNLLDQAHEQLVATGMRPVDANCLLGDARRLVAVHDFWQHQEEGLAAFIAPERFETFRLPVSFDPFATVTEAFHVKPLWPVVAGDLFHVLGISQNDVHLWWADRFQIGEVDLPADIPKSLAAALWYDDPEKQLQHHAVGRENRGRVVAQFHGHGAADERDLEKLEMFLRAVDEGVRSLVDPSAPLVLAGTTEIVARYRHISRHPAIADDSIRYSKGSALQDLHRKASEVVAPVLDRQRSADATAFHAAGDLALAEIAPTVTAALAGRVRALFLPIGVRVWGRTDRDGLDVALHDTRQPGDRDLLDLAGVATWTTGGTVHAVEADDVPGDGPVATLLRYRAG